ncbi:VOC family protein [Terrisporobacter sp.]
MNFCWITLNVKNMEESLKFYHEILGLKIAERFNAGPDTEIVMLGEENGTKVELIYNKNEEVCSKAERLSIGFEVESIEEAMKHFEDNNIALKSGLISPTPSTTFFFVEDPNGIVVQIVKHS